MITRQEELAMIADYIKKHGVTHLAADERGPEYVPPSRWTKSKKKKKK
tara:strand:+ start:131 stop:274 length:144 start_codon:yes stop_codon:yes gene_type:complete